MYTPRRVDDSVPGRQECFTTEDTEVTEALGKAASHTAGLRIRYNHFFLVYEVPRFAAPPLPQSLGKDRNYIHREDAKTRRKTCAGVRAQHCVANHVRSLCVLASSR
jgi:hypothetical protein